MTSISDTLAIKRNTVAQEATKPSDPSKPGLVSDGSTASYYVLPEGAKELQDLISFRDMNAQIGEIFRACFRYGSASHSDQLRDAKKILFYAYAEVKRLEEKAERAKALSMMQANKREA